MNQRMWCGCALLVALAGVNAAAYAGGFLTAPIDYIGARTGLKPLSQMGQYLDDAHRQIKLNIPVYGHLEEAGSSFVREQIQGGCAALFNVAMQPVVAYCSNGSDRMDGRPVIREAETTLVSLGFFSVHDFDSVDIRQCPIGEYAEGLTPDNSRIYIDPAAVNAGAIE